MNLENAKQIRLACLTHAKDLIEIARVNKDNAPHIAYHLAVLALEEVGKSTMTTRELFVPRAKVETFRD
jgi:AbiV family abortive infection protein